MPVTKRKQQHFQLKISLKGSKPLIWRRVVVSGQINLSRLHDIVQRVMGWTDSHLHMFHSDHYGSFSSNSEDQLDMGLGCDDQDESRCRLDAVLPRARMKLIYIYDFGDSWEHEIVLEKFLPALMPEAVPLCIDGANACPPEDCGGLWGYAQMLEALSDPNHEEFESYREWLGRDFDPQQFSTVAVNMQLQRYRRKVKKVQTV